MIDNEGRVIDYLRISLTDRCNLRCQYCMPETGVPYIDHTKILRYEEIERIVEAAASLGVKKIRLTGGEPLLRRGIASLMRSIKAIDGIEEISITTNGFLLESMLEELVEAGLDRINLSLDTLDRETFKHITRFEGFDSVKRGMFKALELGVGLKINAVPLKGINEGDLSSLARLTQEYPMDVRFIELMPIGCGASFTGLTISDVEELLKKDGLHLEDCERAEGNGPATYKQLPGALGKVGFITPMSHNFCGDCNRIRLTAEGFLKPCLFSSRGADLRTMIRDGIDQKKLAEIIGEYIVNKPQAHSFETGADDKRNMNQIGG